MRGRFGRTSGRGCPLASEPRYLSLPPPILPFPPTQPLKGNPYEKLATQHQSQLQLVRLDGYTSIKTYSRDAEDFLSSLKGPPDTSPSSLINSSKLPPSDKFNKNQSLNNLSHYASIEEDDATWTISTNKSKRTTCTSLDLIPFPITSPCKSPILTPKLPKSPTCVSLQQPTPTPSTQTLDQNTSMATTPTIDRVTRSKTKQATHVKSLQTSCPPSALSNDAIPQLITYDMSCADINKIDTEHLRAYLHWWNQEQGKQVSTTAINKMQPALLQKECHKVAEILKARYIAKQDAIADAAIITQETEHSDLQALSDQSLRHLFVKIAQQCGETIPKSSLKLKRRNVLIAAIIDRRNQIEQAMSDVVASTINISDDSSFESEEETLGSDSNSDANDSGTASSTNDNEYDDYDEDPDEMQDDDGVNTLDDYNIQDDEAINDYYNNLDKSDVSNETDNTNHIDISNTTNTITSSDTISATTTTVPSSDSSATTQETQPSSMPTRTHHSQSPKSTSTPKPSTEPKPPTRTHHDEDKNTSVGSLGHSGKNFRGVSIANNNQPPTLQVGSLNVKSVVRTHFIVRASMKLIKGNHVPSIIRKVIQTMRQIDAAFLVHPWDKDDRSTNSIINHEASIPDHEESMATWIRSIGYDRFNRLQFTFRASNTIDYYKFRGIVFQWSQSFGHYVKIDKINAEKVFTAGWLINLHPQLYNRDAIKDWIDVHDFNGELHDKFTVYARKVYQPLPNSNGSIQSEVIAIDGAVTHRDKLFELLTSIEWKGIYHNSGFIPIKTNDVFTSAHVIKAMEAHNTHTASLLSKTIHIKHYDKVITHLSNGTETTFTKWLSACLIQQEKLFIAVETGEPHFVRMIYTNSNHFHVLSIVNDLHSSMTKYFGKDVAVDILGSGTSYSTSMPATNKEASFFTALANTYEANPQDTAIVTPPPVKRRPKPPTAWFGPNPVLENIEVVTTSSSQPSSQLTGDDTSKLSDIEKRLNNISAVNANLQTTVSAIVDKKLSPINTSIQQLSTSVTTLETSVQQTNKVNTIKFNTIVSDVGLAITKVRKREKTRAKRNTEALLQALNNINAKIGVAPVKSLEDPAELLDSPVEEANEQVPCDESTGEEE